MDIPIIEQLGYSDKQKECLRSLWKDDNCRLDIQKAIGNQLASSDAIIIGNSLNQLCLLTCQAQFATSDSETITVAVMMVFCLRLPDIFPSLMDHKGKAFAARSLISLGMFRTAMEARYLRRAAPSPDYYRRVGQLYFQQGDLPEIANHFTSWEKFLAERFV